MSDLRIEALRHAVALALQDASVDVVAEANKFLRCLGGEAEAVVAEVKGAKAKKATNPTPTASAAPDANAAPVSAPATTAATQQAGTVSLKTVSDAMTELAVKKGRSAAASILQTFGVERASMLQPAQLGPALSAFTAALGSAVGVPVQTVESLI